MIRPFLEELCKTNRGCIWACNLLHAIEDPPEQEESFRYLPLISGDRAKKVRAFLQKCADGYDPQVKYTPNRFLGYIDNIFLDAVTNEDSELRFLCDYPTTRFHKESEYCTVMSYDTFISFLADRCTASDKELMKIKNWGSPLVTFPPNGVREWDPEFTNKVFSFHLKKKVLDYKKNKESPLFIGRYEKSCFWITCYRNLVKKLRKVSEEKYAEAARDMLGLIHYPETSEDCVFLVGLVFKNDQLGTKQSARPVFLNANTHTRFRTLADKSSNGRRKGWGCTLDLKQLALNNVEVACPVDGLMERVVESIPTELVKTIPVHFLGTVKERRGTKPCDGHGVFKDLLLGDRDEIKIVEKLMEKLNET